MWLLGRAAYSIQHRGDPWDTLQTLMRRMMFPLVSMKCRVSPSRGRQLVLHISNEAS